MLISGLKGLRHVSVTTLLLNKYVSCVQTDYIHSELPRPLYSVHAYVTVLLGNFVNF